MHAFTSTASNPSVCRYCLRTEPQHETGGAPMSKRTRQAIENALKLPAPNAARVLTAIWRAGNRNDQNAVECVLRANPQVDGHTTWTTTGCLIAR